MNLADSFRFEDLGEGGWVDIEVAAGAKRIELEILGDRVGGSIGSWSPNVILQLAVELEAAAAKAAQATRNQVTEGRPLGGPSEDYWLRVGTVANHVSFHVMAGGGDSEMVLVGPDAARFAELLRKAAQKSSG